ncbi:hypothetical protein T265_03608 [Opisthorchis viverrini]|uniref:DUF5731 domain-containing protein n=1 Tax=Opisthorchis viverrini TaxID=6198 RepID=A0A075AHF8_OPIVI|nr:hypothetical protein T265_03608 [Opisthorchis viverrini]KER29809.1 hypothetical protein T265_03608 [Opisthorchis viverrini]
MAPDVARFISLSFLEIHGLQNRKRCMLLLWVCVFMLCAVSSGLQYYPPGRRWRSLAPCAWLERGGIFDMPKYHTGKGPLIQRRQTCHGRIKCPLTWLPTQDTQSITFKLVGTDDMRDYEFQAHFCSPIYAFHHRYCTGAEAEIAFELRQTGTWLMLDRVNCRCLGVADVERYGYSKGVLPKDKVFRGNYIQMTCAKRPTCTEDQFCYVETPSTNGYIYGGQVPCICPKEHYCPLYFIRDKRIPQKNQEGRIVSYGLRCKRRLY